MERGALNEIMDMLGEFSLSRATTQQIKSVYVHRSVAVSEVLADGMPLHLLPPAEATSSDMGAAEFDLDDI